MRNPTSLRFRLTALGALALSAFTASADLAGPYTPDANTLFLFHFDEAAGGTATVNAGSKGKSSYTVTEATASATPATVTTMLGAAGYSTVSPLAISFGNCITNPTTGYVVGYDANNSGAYQGEGTAPCPDALSLTNLNIGNGGQTPFTIEALIRPTTLAFNQEIVCTDSSGASRGFQFRIVSPGSLQFQFIANNQAVSATIPTSGADAFVAGEWYHVAIVYNGSTATLYWTKVDPSNGAAHVIGSPASLTLGTAQGAVTGPLCIGNENRAAAGEQFQGCIDEVRISSVARAANQMQFFSPLVTITANPVSQNIDYNQPVTFSVGASSLTDLSYQWRFNSAPVSGLTNSSFTITNVAAGNAGSYDCVVTNTAGYAATSSPALLVVGAANFLANRYSFATDTTDSVGGQTGTNFGNATVTGGKLVLDGTQGTYMQLPPNLFNAANATALTVEFWATFGSNPNNVYAFAFGTTNFVFSQGLVGFNFAMYSPHNASGQTLSSSPGDPQFAQSVSAAGNLDGRTVHVACVIDPPNKMLSIYTNGVLEAVNTNFTINIANLNDAFSYIGKSLWEADPYLNANIDELRIFKGALSPITIKQSQDQGPDTLLADGPASFVLQPANTSIPVNQIATFTAAAVGYLPITYQWFKNGSLVPDATNASYSFVATLADNNSTYIAWATNIIGVTTYITNSQTATLTVYTPPTLTWLDFANGAQDGDWNTTSLNWTNVPASGGLKAFSQTDAVLFNSLGSGSTFVSVTEPVQPSGIRADATFDYTIYSGNGNGALTGQGTITKLNSGRLIIDVTNDLSGAVTISGGTLQIGNGDANGSLGSSQVTNNATLSFSRNDTALNVGNSIHGSGTVSFDNSGAVTVSGNSDYTGSTLLNSGIVYLQSSSGLGSSSVGTTVGSSGQLYVNLNVDVPEPLNLSGSGPDSNGALRKGGAGLTAASGAVALASDTLINVDGGSTLVFTNSTIIGSGFNLTFTGSGNEAIYSPISLGAGSLTKNGNGTLSLDAANSYSGGTTLSAGVVDVNNNAALSSGLVTVNGGRLVLGDGVTVANAFLANTVSPGAVTGMIMVNDNTNGTVTTVSGPITVLSSAVNGGVFFGPTSSGYLNITGKVTNNTTGDISSRLGNVRFSGGGDYTLFDLREGTLSIGANNGLSTSASLKMAASGTAIFDLNGFNQSLTGLTDGAALLEIVTNSTATASTLTLNLSIGSLFNGTIAGNVALVQNGAATLQLMGTNAYTGNTTVNGGTLELAQPTLAAASTVTVANGAFLQLDFNTTNKVAGLILNGASQPIGVYNSTTSPSFITGSGSLEVASPIASNPTNITFSIGGGNLTISWPASHLGWILQSQTNALSTGLSANWTDVAGSSSSTQAVITVNAANPSVFYRLRHP